MSSQVNKTTVNSGIGFTGALLILFIALKLTKQIEWNWIWVLSPIWVSISLVVALVLIVLIGTMIIVALDSRAPKRKL